MYYNNILIKKKRKYYSNILIKRKRKYCNNILIKKKRKYRRTVTPHRIVTHTVLLYRKVIFYAYNICIRIDRKWNKFKDKLRQINTVRTVQVIIIKYNSVQ